MVIKQEARPDPRPGTVPALRVQGRPVDDDLFQYLSPLGWEHINLTGDYIWHRNARVGAGKFSPLRPLAEA